MPTRGSVSLVGRAVESGTLERWLVAVSVSSERARFLVVTEPGSFDDFMRELAEPAAELAVPPAATEPPDIAALAATAAPDGGR